MKYPPELRDWIKNNLHPILREITPIKLIKQKPELIEDLRKRINNIETEQKLFIWLKSQRVMYCTDKALQETKSGNYIKQTNFKEQVVKKKISKSKPIIEITPEGEKQTVQYIKEENETQEKTYSKLEYVFKTEYAEKAIEEINKDSKRISDLSKFFDAQARRHLLNAEDRIKKAEKDSHQSLKTRFAALKAIENELINKINEYNANKQDLVVYNTPEGKTKVYSLIDQIDNLCEKLDNQTTKYNRLITSSSYSIANIAVPISENVLNKLKTLQDAKMKQTLHVHKLNETDVMLVERHLKESGTKDVNEELPEMVVDLVHKINNLEKDEGLISDFEEYKKGGNRVDCPK